MVRSMVVAAAAALVADAAVADALVGKAKRFDLSGPPYIFDVLIEDEQTTFRLTVDQSRPKGDRVVAMSSDPAELTGEAQKRADMLRKRTQGDIWCNVFAASIPEDAKRISETETRATYAFTPIPGKEAGQFASAYRHLDGMAVLDKASGAVLAFELTASRPFKPMAVAKVDTFEMRVACAKAPDGRTHVASLSFDLDASAMMQKVSQRERRRISQLTPLATSRLGAP